MYCIIKVAVVNLTLGVKVEQSGDLLNLLESKVLAWLWFLSLLVWMLGL